MGVGTRYQMHHTDEMQLVQQHVPHCNYVHVSLCHRRHVKFKGAIVSFLFVVVHFREGTWRKAARPQASRRLWTWGQAGFPGYEGRHEASVFGYILTPATRSPTSALEDSPAGIT